MHYQIELVELKPVATAVVRSQVPVREFARFVPAACGEVWSYVGAAGLPKPGRYVALYRKDGMVEAGVEMTGLFAGNERALCSQLPGGTVASTVQFGPYGRLGEAHSAIREWSSHARRKFLGVSWELYGHGEESWKTNPAKIRTDVFYQLAD